MQKSTLLLYFAMLFVLAGSHLSTAETELVVTNGQHYKGTIVEETDNAIILYMDGNQINIFKTMIISRTDDGVPYTQKEQATPAANENIQQPPAIQPKEDSRSNRILAQPPAVEQINPYVPPVPATPPAPVPEEMKNTLGIDFSYNYLNYSYDFSGNYKTKTDHTVSGFDMSINPYIAIRTRKYFEVRISVGLSHSSTAMELNFNENKQMNGSDTIGSFTTSDTTSDNTITASTSSYGLSASLGFFFLKTTNGPFRFSFGPSLFYQQNFQQTYTVNDHVVDGYDNYININTGVNVPFNLDFMLTNRVGFRLSNDIFRISGRGVYIKNDSPSIDEINIHITTKFLTDWSPQFGLFMFY